MLNRRGFLSAAAAGASLALTEGARAQQPVAPEAGSAFPSRLPAPDRVRYPEANIRALDPRFNKYIVPNTYIERLWTGALWAEGPVWFGDVGLLIFSDIPNNRLLKYDEESGQVSVLRQPSSYANGNTRDRDGRLLTCEQDQRAVLRTEYDGKLTVLAANFLGKRLNGPNDIVARSDGTVWFSDPGYGIGSFYESDHQTGAELPNAVYRVDPRVGRIDVATKDQVRPNGLAFSHDEKTLYITDTGITDGPEHPSDITAYDVDDKGKLVNRRTVFDLKKAVPAMRQAALDAAAGSSTPPGAAKHPAKAESGPQAGFYKYGIADGIRVDVDGNIWAATGWAGPVIDGVTVIAADGTAIGRIFMPEVVANLAFGGLKRNRLFMAGSTSLYGLYVNIAGGGFG